MTVVRMNDFRAEPSELVAAELEAARRVITSGWYVLGREGEEFEEQWALRCGVSHAVGVANGMDAIEIALRTCGIGAGCEVITTPMTAFATVLAVLRAGATPVLADVDPETGLLDLESASRCVTARTRALLLVHLYGHVSRMNEWLAFCADRRIVLIEDCAQAHLAQWQGQVAGSFGAWGAYSFYPTKNLGALGDAGALVTNSAERATHARAMRNYGQTVRYSHPIIGLNSRLDELHAAILKERLNWLDRFTERRRQIAAAYLRGISNERVRILGRPLSPENHVYHLFVIACERRDELHAFLRDHGIESHSHYPIPIHRQESCTGIMRDPSGLRFSEAHAATCLSLPCHPNLSAEQLDRVIGVVNEFR